MMSFLAALLPLAHAGALPAAEDFASTYGAEAPNILFLIDLSERMHQSCGEGKTCLQRSLESIEAIARGNDWAHIGVVATTLDGDDDDFTPISPLGVSRDDLAAALSGSMPIGGLVRNPSEALAALSLQYFSLPDTSDEPDAWDEGPICFSCQDTHVITVTAGLPRHDNQPDLGSIGTTGTNIRCDASGSWSSSSDVRCLYDDLVRRAYVTDSRPDLPGVQRVVTHTVGVTLDGSSIAQLLYWGASLQTQYDGLYTQAETGDDIRAALGWTVEWIRWSLAGTSPPVIASSGDQLFVAWHDVDTSSPLPRGHLRAYAVADDPSDPASFGDVVYEGDAALDGALWDAGEILEDREVLAGEQNEDDRDGAGARDIYTFLPELTSASANPIVQQALADGRFSFDSQLVALLGQVPDALEALIDGGSDVAADSPWDLDRDGDADRDDVQSLVDFARGEPAAQLRYVDWARGAWKLGGARSAPAIVRARHGRYAAEGTYRAFLRLQALSGNPDVALLASDDGLLHAFRLSDGAELWAWIPAYLLYRDPGEGWSGRLWDLALGDHPTLLAGDITVEDVWIDLDGDGQKRCSSLPDDCEWRRVALVAQGRGGPGVLALDITDPTAPSFLWEHANAAEPEANGYAVSRPVVAPVWGGAESWVALWAGGYPVLPGVSEEDAASVEPALRVRAMSDRFAADPQTSFAAHVAASSLPAEGLAFPVSDGLGDSDGDGRPEGAHIATAPAALDIDGDGDTDAVYLALTSEGSSRIVKLLLDPLDLTQSSWCTLADLETLAGQPVEVYRALTLSWLADGSLGIYAGSGTPFDGASQDAGALVALRDPSPGSCATPQPLCGASGIVSLGAGERLTSEPIVAAGVVYFSTWTSDPDGCGAGEGRVYGLRYDTCGGMLDQATASVSSDGRYLALSGYPGSIALSDQGRLLYSSAPAVSGIQGSIGSLTLADPYRGTSFVSFSVRQ